MGNIGRQNRQYCNLTQNIGGTFELYVRWWQTQKPSIDPVADSYGKTIGEASMPRHIKDIAYGKMITSIVVAGKGA